MSTTAQKALKAFIGSLKWADEMFLAAEHADDVDINALARECSRVLENRRADTLCMVVNPNGVERCVLSKMHGDTPHKFDEKQQ